MAASAHGAVSASAAAAAGSLSLLFLADQRPHNQGHCRQENQADKNASDIRDKPLQHNNSLLSHSVLMGSPVVSRAASVSSRLYRVIRQGSSAEMAHRNLRRNCRVLPYTLESLVASL